MFQRIIDEHFGKPSLGHPGNPPANAAAVTRELTNAGLAERLFPNNPELRPFICRHPGACEHSTQRVWVQEFNGQIRFGVLYGDRGSPQVIDFTPGRPFNGGKPLGAEQEALVVRLAEESRLAEASRSTDS